MTKFDENGVTPEYIQELTNKIVADNRRIESGNIVSAILPKPEKVDLYDVMEELAFVKKQNIIIIEELKKVLSKLDETDKRFDEIKSQIRIWS